jgi:hypothetical protein
MHNMVLGPSSPTAEQIDSTGAFDVHAPCLFDEQIARFEAILGCPVRVIYKHI